VVSIGILICLLVVVLPLLHSLTGSRLDLASFNALKEGVIMDRVFALLGWLVLTWTLAAFGEELVYRAYLQNRLIDLLGDNTSGWIITVGVTSTVFGFAHLYQGIVGVITTFLIAVVYSVIYLKFQRNIYASILVHGFYDTISFLALFFFGDALGLL
jgi:membrane protease YdiL (CAAX protease family)